MTLWGKLVQRCGRFLYPGYGAHLFCGDAATNIAPEAYRWCVGKGNDFGAGVWPLAGADPIDTGTALQLELIAPRTQDFVFSSHTLEHIPDWRYVLCHFHRVLRRGGVLFLYLPHESMKLWNPETIWGRAAGHVWQPRLETLLGWAYLAGFRVRHYVSGPDSYHSWFIVLEKQRGFSGGSE